MPCPSVCLSPAFEPECFTFLTKVSVSAIAPPQSVGIAGVGTRDPNIDTNKVLVCHCVTLDDFRQQKTDHPLEGGRLKNVLGRL